MADTVSYSNELKIDALFVDGDTRTLNVKNPKANIAQSDIAALNTFMQTNNILVGDKYGGRFGRIDTASVVNKSTVNLDLEPS